MSGVRVYPFRCRDCKIIVGKRTDDPPEECPNCGLIGEASFAHVEHWIPRTQDTEEQEGSMIGTPHIGVQLDRNHAGDWLVWYDCEVDVDGHVSFNARADTIPAALEKLAEKMRGERV